MKKLIIAFSILAFFSFDSFSQKKIMQVTTVESIIPGGLGRSKMIITNEDGTQMEKPMENFYSMVGINFGNIKSNELAILDELKKWIAEGWELKFTTTGVQSPAQGGGSQGIYMTRYIFMK
ncbi:MAG: hypothetical protein KA275_02775 [Chitinophagaceae bacterium]|nr:hypothetical protein [Chitinophagaceae bacterium]